MYGHQFADHTIEVTLAAENNTRFLQIFHAIGKVFSPESVEKLAKPIASFRIYIKEETDQQMDVNEPFLGLVALAHVKLHLSAVSLLQQTGMGGLQRLQYLAVPVAVLKKKVGGRIGGMWRWFAYRATCFLFFLRYIGMQDPDRHQIRGRGRD